MLLADGRALITGGANTVGVLDLAETFNEGGAFTSVAHMTSARSGHSCTALSDGRVLVAGGKSDNGTLGSAEIYDPALNRWTDAGVLGAPRFGHTSTLLHDGRIALVGGEGSGLVHDSIEIFDPADSAFHTVPARLSSPRKEHGAALLGDGRLMIVGGSDGKAALATSDIFEARRSIVERGPSMNVGRAGLSVASLLDGNLLVAGGNDGEKDLSSAEVYDTSGKFVLTGRMASTRRNALAFRLPDNNQILLIGGDDSGNTAELFTPWAGGFRSAGALPEGRTGASGTALRSEGYLLLSGGRSRQLPIESSRVYKFATLKTDQDLYTPGALMTVNGSGWIPGERVSLRVRENSKDRTITATADQSGMIRGDIQLTSGARGTVSVTAAGSADQAQAVAQANAAANLDQCANGTFASPTGCVTSAAWVNGNVNGSKAHYVEGDFLPYRMVMTNLTLGTHTLTIEWDTTQGGKHALDYIGTYNATETTANPCVGLSCGSPTTFNIPADPNIPFAQSPGVFTMFGGTITSLPIPAGATSPYTLSGVYTSNSSTRISITFTAAQSTVVLSWAGHIADHRFWGAGSSAAAISGSPFHTRLVGLDGSGGSQDRALSSDAVIFPASITIIKNAVPKSTDSFPFTITGGLTPASFSLVDSTAGTDLTESRTFTGITTFQTYTVTETVPSGWQSPPVISCSPQNQNGGTTSGTSPAVNINLKEGEDWTCTYTNTKQAGITIRKVTDNSDTTTDFTFTTTGTGLSGFTLKGGAKRDFISLNTGSYTVTESTLSGWHLSDLQCSSSGTGTSATPNTGTRSVSITLGAGGSVDCTYTNAKNTVNLIVKKVLSPAADPGLFDLNIGATLVKDSAKNNDTGNKTVTVGDSVTVSELGHTGTTLTNYTSTLSCDNSVTPSPNNNTSGTITIPDVAGPITCTFTNTRKTLTLNVKKSLSPTNDPGLFDLSIAGTVVGNGVGHNGQGSQTVNVGDTVSISEAGHTGTTIGNYTSTLACDNSVTPNPNNNTSGSIVVPNVAGPVTCTFTNTRKTVTLNLKKSLTEGDPGLFDLTIAGSAVATGVGNNGQGSKTVNVGDSVALLEAGHTGTTLANYTSTLACDNSITPNPNNNTSGTISIPDVAGPINCTFTNTRKTLTLYVKKSLTAGDPGLFDLSIAGTVAATGVGNNGQGSQTVNVGDTVSLSEAGHSGTTLANYTSTLSCDNSVAPSPNNNTSGSIVVPNIAGPVTCTFTNTRKTLTLYVKKSLSSGDSGLFDLSIGANVVANGVGNNGQGSQTVNIGDTVSVAEAAHTGTTLSNYTSTLSCDNGATPSPNNNTSGSIVVPNVVGPVTCTFTNTRKTITLTLKKVLTVSGDNGTFDLSIAGTAVATGVGNNGTGSATVKVGDTVAIAEAGHSPTSLSSYISALSCDNGVAPSPNNNTSGSITVPDVAGPVTCTFTNTRKTATLIVAKVCAGIPAPGTTFTINIDNSTHTTASVACGHAVSKQVDIGTYTVTEQTPPAGWNLPGADGSLPNGWKAPGQIKCNNLDTNQVTLGNGDTATCVVLNVSDACIPAFPGVVPAPDGSGAGVSSPVRPYTQPRSLPPVRRK